MYKKKYEKAEPTPMQKNCHTRGCVHVAPSVAYRHGKECAERDIKLNRYDKNVVADGDFNIDWRRGYLEVGRKNKLV